MGGKHNQARENKNKILQREVKRRKREREREKRNWVENGVSGSRWCPHDLRPESVAVAVISLSLATRAVAAARARKFGRRLSRALFFPLVISYFFWLFSSSSSSSVSTSFLFCSQPLIRFLFVLSVFPIFSHHSPGCLTHSLFHFLHVGISCKRRSFYWFLFFPF